MGDETSNKNRRPKWATSYLKMTIEEAEKRPDIRIDGLQAVPVESGRQA